MHYQILDFKAVVKHAYYGASDPEAIHCEVKDRRFPHWQVGAAGVLSRYIQPILDDGDSLRHLIIAHDMGHECRKGIYAEYKGQKAKKDENKSPVETEQLDQLYTWCKQFFTAVGATQIGVKGVEADDVIAWVAEGVQAAGGSLTIRTVDFDLAQLVSDAVSVITPNYTFFGAEGVFETEGKNDLDGFPFYLTSFCKSILGDSSDNYGGVKGMGKVALLNLQREFGNDGLLELQQIVDSGNTDLLNEAIEQSGSKELKKLLSQFSEWKLGWRLAILRPELCWKPRKNKLVKPMVHKRVPMPAKTLELLTAIDHQGQYDDIYAPMMPNPFVVDAANWGDYREGILEEIVAGDLMSFDYESSDKCPIPQFRQASGAGENFVDAMSQELAGASFQFGRHLENVIYIPVDHRDSMNLNKDVILEILNHAKERGVRRVAHNAFFEGVVTKNNLGEWLQDVEDTRIMQRFYDENSEAGLKFISAEYLGYDQVSFKDTLATGSIREGGAKFMAELTAEEVLSYGADDSLVTGHLADLLQLQLVLDRQWLFYQEWAVKPTEVLQRAYVHGVRMNWALQKRLHQRDLDTIAVGMAELREILKKNVSGNQTPGAASLIAAEKDFIYKSALKKYDDKEQASLKLSEWKKKIESACQYTPYREEQVMPTFAFTAKQVSEAAVAVGLPALEKLNFKAWSDYMASVGAEGFSADWPLTDPQRELVSTVSKGMEVGCFNLSTLRKKVDEGPAAGDKIGPEVWEQKLAAAEAYWNTLAEVVQRLARVETRTVSFGDPLNVGSPQQMQQLLYCKIGVPVRLRGKISKGRLQIGIREAGPSTDEKAVEWALANDITADGWEREALAVLLKVKSATTRCSLYHDKWPLWRHRDGFVHPYVTDYGTDTGRPTASSMNVLQVSKKDKIMRSCFIPPSQDYLCVAIDFNGQEIRLMANLAQDPVMLSVYEPGNEKDLHSMTASGIAKMEYGAFVAARGDKEHVFNKKAGKLRDKAKTINFGMAYGAGPGTLSRNLVAPVEEAKQLLDGTMSLYYRIKPWQEETGQFMSKHGYTLTAYGNKRHATNDLFSTDSGKVSRQHRQGTNFTIQGTAADMLRIALTKVASSGMMDRLRMVFFAPIYDEVVSWVHKDDVLEYCREMGAILESTTPPGHTVRQVPEYSIGCDWGNVHELGRDISPENVSKYVELALKDGKPIWEVDVLEPFDPILKRVLVELDEDEEAEVEEVVC